MSTQSEALLAIATAYSDTPPDALARVEGRLWSNPIICTPAVYEAAEMEGDEVEVVALGKMLEAGLIVKADDPSGERARLAGKRPGYENRATRRASKGGKAGKVK